MKKTREIKAVVRIIALNDQKSTYHYWQTQSYQARMDTLEQIRCEYHQWRYGAEPGFQKVFKIIKR